MKPGTASKNAAEKPNKPVLHGKIPTPTAPKTAEDIASPDAAASNGYVTFNTTSNPVVQAKVGISYVSVANATANRAAENTGWDFTATRTAAQNAWNSALGKIQIAAWNSRTATELLHRALPLAAAPERHQRHQRPVLRI